MASFTLWRTLSSSFKNQSFIWNTKTLLFQMQLKKMRFNWNFSMIMKAAAKVVEEISFVKWDSIVQILTQNYSLTMKRRLRLKIKSRKLKRMKKELWEETKITNKSKTKSSQKLVKILKMKLHLLKYSMRRFFKKQDLVRLQVMLLQLLLTFLFSFLAENTAWTCTIAMLSFMEELTITKSCMRT